MALFYIALVVGVVLVAVPQISPDVFIADIWAPSFVALVRGAVFATIIGRFLLAIVPRQ